MKIKKLDIYMARIADRLLRWLPNDGTMLLTRKCVGRIRWYFKLRMLGVSKSNDILLKVIPNINDYRDGVDNDIKMLQIKPPAPIIPDYKQEFFALRLYGFVIYKPKHVVYTRIEI